MRPPDEVMATVQKPFQASDRTAGGPAYSSLRYSGRAAEPATPGSTASRFIGKELRRALHKRDRDGGQHRTTGVLEPLGGRKAAHRDRILARLAHRAPGRRIA